MENILDKKNKPKRRGVKPKWPCLRFIKYSLYNIYWLFFPQERRVMSFTELLIPLLLILFVVFMAAMFSR